MKVVIDISEEDYNFVKKQVADGITNPLKIRVANGTPLPKGHGKLIDADVFRKELIANEWITNDDGGGLEDLLDYAHTIIEADRAESEDKI